MSTIITKNSANSGSIPASLVQGELAINVTDGRLFYGSGSGNAVKEFTGSASGGTIDTGSFATTGSNTFIGNQTISGTLYQSGTFFPDQIDWFSSSIGYDTGSYILTTTANGLTTYANYQDVATIINSGLLTTSSFNAYTGSSTSQFAGTASYATNALSASYAVSASYEINYETSSSYADFAVSASYAVNADNATSASYASQAGNAAAIDIYSFSSPVDSYLLMSNVIATTGVAVGGDTDLRYNSSTNTLTAVNISATSLTGSLLGTASYATTALSSSYALNATSASYALNGGVTQILAGSNITISPTTGKGQVTISSTGGSGPFFNTATGSYGSFYDTTTQTNPVANIARSMSFNTTDISNGVSISGSTSPFNTYIKTENPGVYNIQFSAQVDKTDGGTDDIVIWLRKNGIDLTDTATTLTLPTNNSKVVAAWNWFVNSAANDYYQIIWLSADTDLRLLAETAGGGHPGIPSVILTVNRVDQFLSNTGSFSGSFTGTLTGTASYATQALSSSFSTTASYYGGSVTSASYALTATSASYVLNAVSASFASTASSVNTLNQNVLITGSLTVGASTAGASENTLTLGPRDAGSEGGQLMLQAPGGTYTSASMWDNYANLTRLLRGTNAGSDAVVAQFNMHTKQVSFPQYNSPTAFTGTTLVGLLGFDSSGNLITTTTSSGGGGGGVTITNNVDNYVITATGTANTINGESNMQFNGSSLSITGEITSSGAIRSLANGAMYFRGGDDAEFWDINVANTVGIYGQQTQTVAGLKLGSAGATLYGSGSRFGIGTTSPVATLDVNGNLYVASGITGSLQGTASYATQALSASYAPSTSTFPYTGSAEITGSLGVTGSFSVLDSIDAANKILIGSGPIPGSTEDSVNWDSRTLFDSNGNFSARWGTLRSLYDANASQSVDWNNRLLKFDNGLGDYTVNWSSGLLRDTGSNNSVDWQNRITIDTGNKTSIDWQNRQLKNSSGNEVLNWSSGVAITGSLTVSGSSTFTNIGPARFSGSFVVQGDLIPGSPPMIPNIGPYDAIKVDDINFERKLYGSPNQGASSSIDFGNRLLTDVTGLNVLSWGSSGHEFTTYKYNDQQIGDSTRNNLYTSGQAVGQILIDSYFDAAVQDNDLVYLGNGGEWVQVNQSFDSSTRMLGIAKNVFSQTGSVFIEGDVVVTTSTGYPIVTGANYGIPVYIAEGAGTTMSTSTPTSGYVRILGHCYYNTGGNEWIMKFRPSNEWIVL